MRRIAKFTNLKGVAAKPALEDNTSAAPATTTPATPPETPATPPATEGIKGALAGGVVGAVVSGGSPIGAVVGGVAGHLAEKLHNKDKAAAVNEEKDKMAASKPAGNNTATEDITTPGEQTTGAETNTPGATLIEKPEVDSPGAQVLEEPKTESPGAPETVASEDTAAPVFTLEEMAKIAGGAVTEAIKQAYIVKGNFIPPGKITPTAKGLSGGPTKEKTMTVTQPEKDTVKEVPKPATAKANPVFESATDTPPTDAEPAMATEGTAAKTTPTATGLSGGPTKEKEMTVTQPKEEKTVEVPAPPTTKKNPALEADGETPPALPDDVKTEETPPAAVPPAAEPVAAAPGSEVTPPVPAAEVPAAAPVEAAPVAAPAPMPEAPAAIPAAPAEATAPDNVIPPTDPAEVPPAMATDGTQLPPEANNGGAAADGTPGQVDTPEKMDGAVPGNDVAPEFPADPAPVPTVTAPGETPADPAAADLTLDPGASIVEIEDTDLTSNEDGISDDIFSLEPVEGEEEPIDMEMVSGAEKVTEALESIYVSLESSLAGGGLTKPMADVVMLSMENLYDQVGLKKPGTNVKVALESMHSAEQSIANAQLAMEDIKSSVITIKNSIIKAIKRGIMMIKQFFGRIFVTARKVQKRAHTMATKISQMKGEATEKVFTHKRIAKRLVIDNAIPSNLMAEIAYFTELSKEVLSNQLSYGVGPMVSKFKQIISSTTDEEFYKHMEFKTNHKIFSQTPDKTKIDFDVVIQDGYHLVSSKPYFGNNILVGIIPEDSTTGEKLFHGLSNMEMEVSKYGTMKEEADREIPVLSIADATTVCKQVMSIATDLIEYEKDFGRVMGLLYKIEEDVNSMRNFGEQLGGAIGAIGGAAIGGVDGAKQGGHVGSMVGGKIAEAVTNKSTPPVVLKARRLVYSLVNICMEPAMDFSTDALAVGNALLDYAEASTKLYHQ